MSASPGLSARFVTSRGCFAATVLVLMTSGARRDEKTPLESVVKIWRERELATKSVRIEFGGDYVMGKGSMPGGPPEDVMTTEERTVVIDGVKMRHERRFSLWNDATNALEPTRRVSVFDGVLSKTLSDPRRADGAHRPLGWVTRAQAHNDRSNVYLSPILRHYRPLSPAFGVIKTERLKIADAKEIVDGLSCVVLEEPQVDTAQVCKYWVAPEQEMSIVRFVRLSAGAVMLQADVTYRREDGAWVPARWKAIRYGSKDNVLDSCSATLKRIEINAPVNAATFDIEFPEGTEVFDGPAKKRFVMKTDG